MTILVAAGGTGGHLSPALVVADNLRSRGHDVHFATSDNGRDDIFIRERGYSALTFSISFIPRKGILKQIAALARAAKAVVSCSSIIRRVRPDVVLCGGGFVCAPMAVAARLQGIVVIATEVDSHLGLANKVAARCAKRLCTGFPLRQFRLKQEVTGRPVSPEFYATDRLESRRELGIDGDTPTIVVVGGSGGALKLSESAFAAFGETELVIDDRQARVIHVTGKRDFQALSAAVAERGHNNSDAYQLIEFSNNMPTLLAAADLVISRAGGTIFEIAAVGRPAILIPFPFAAADHQRTNARHFERAGAALYLDDNDCTGTTLREMSINVLCKSGAKQREKLVSAIKQMGTRDAAARIATIVERAANITENEQSSDLLETTTEVAAASLEGRTFHMMGIGGAGVSALAQLASAWGANVTGCDREVSTYSVLVDAAGIPVVVGHSASHIVPGIELVVSSAIPLGHPERVRAGELGIPEMLRGQLLGELTKSRRTVVVAGAHGKSTTTAMIVHIAHACGIDCSAMVGARVASLNSNMHVGSSEWFVVEGDESDRTLLELSADVAVVTNVERDHHHTFTSDDQVFDLFAQWVNSLDPNAQRILGDGVGTLRLANLLEHVPTRVSDETDLSGEIEAVITLPGRHNIQNGVCAVLAAEAMGIARGEAVAALASFRGLGRRFEIVGTIGSTTVVDDYSHHPTEVSAALEGAREFASTHGSGRVVVIFQPHLYSRTQALHREFAEALSLADVALLLPIYGAREDPIDGIDSELIVRAMPEESASVANMDPATGELSTILAVVREGDCVVTMGAGSVTELAPRLVAALQQQNGAEGADNNNGRVSVAAAPASVPAWIERDVPLNRFTTIGTGGLARYFARVGSVSDLSEALRFAESNEIPTAVVGLGSNTLIADVGFDGVAIRLVDDLARIDIDADSATVVCGGGASLAAVVRLCRDAGLAGFEFGCAIPGTIGGAVKMNAGAYGGEMVEVLKTARLVSSTVDRTVTPGDLAMTYRHTNIGWSEIVAEATLTLSHDDPDAIKARVKDMQKQRSDSQPRAARSFGSVFRNPLNADGTKAELGAGALIERAGLKGHTIGGACISPKHGNFIENAGNASTADVLALIDLARTTVAADSGVTLVTEVHLLDRNGYRPLHDDVEIHS